MKVTVRRISISLLLCLLTACPAVASLSGRVNAIVSRDSLKKVRFGIQIVEADTGKTVYRRNATEAMIPASNMKIIATATALKYLGGDFEYTTKVGLLGDSLVIIGSGDPLLGDEKTEAKHGRQRHWVLDDIVAALKEHGVTNVNDVIVDTSVFDDERVHLSWPEDQLNRWYACEVSGLNYNDNCIAISARNSPATRNRYAIFGLRKKASMQASSVYDMPGWEHFRSTFLNPEDTQMSI